MLYNLAFFINLIFSSAHPFHVSVCDIFFNEKAKSVEITHKIFLDDLEEALKEDAGYSVDILKRLENNQLKELLINYLKSNFSCAVDGEKLTLTYIGSEVQEDALWVYQEAVNVERFSEVEVKNTVLLGLFDDQTNLVHVKKGKKIKSLRLYDGHKRGEVNFK